MMKRPPILLALSTAILVACGGSGPTPSPDGSPTASPTTGEIDHPTGPTDVVLRLEEGGGLMPLGFLAGQAPTFTLYGDGTVIFRDVTEAIPPAVNGIQPERPFRIVRLTEDDLQELLAFVIGPGALGIARASYDPGNVMDAGTSIFDLHAGGVNKSVSVVALGFDNPQSPDAPILRSLALAGARLREFKPPGSAPWTPERYRGVLVEDGFGAPRDWPWPDLAPAAFTPLRLPSGQTWQAHTMTEPEIEALAASGLEGGFSGLALSGPDGKLYSFALRPLLPDEPR